MERSMIDVASGGALVTFPSTANPPLHHHHHHHPPFVPATTHKMKLEVPHFDGTEPLDWIFKISNTLSTMALRTRTDSP